MQWPSYTNYVISQALGGRGAHRTFQSLYRLARNHRQQSAVKWSIFLLLSAKMPLISPINCILTYPTRRMSSKLPTGVRDNAVCEMNGTLGFSKLPRNFFHKWYTIFLAWIVFSYQPRWLPKLSSAIRISSTFIMFNKRDNFKYVFTKIKITSCKMNPRSVSYNMMQFQPP